MESQYGEVFSYFTVTKKGEPLLFIPLLDEICLTTTQILEPIYTTIRLPRLLIQLA